MTQTAPHNQFGDTIRKARLQKGLSLRQAAEKIGVSPSYLSSVELNKEGQVPTDDMISRISTVVGVSFATLRELAVHITHDLKAMKKKISPREAEDMQSFYRVMKENKITTQRGLDLFIRAVQAESKK